MERRRTIALLPNREPATAQAWLSAQPQIALVARDRGGGYALAAAKALPDAVQGADRWHLMENASRAFLDAVRKSMRQVRAAIGAAAINPSLLTAAERIQYEEYLRREEDNAAILGLSNDGITIKDRAPDGAQPRPRPQDLARSAVRHFPRQGKLARAVSTLAR